MKRVPGKEKKIDSESRPMSKIFRLVRSKKRVL